MPSRGEADRHTTSRAEGHYPVGGAQRVLQQYDIAADNDLGFRPGIARRGGDPRRRACARHVSPGLAVPRHRHGVLTARPLTPTGQASAVPRPASGSGPTTGGPKVNPATCFFTFTGGGKFTVSGGTGACKGISGSGKVVLSIVGILGRTKERRLVDEP
jgi:hypothetical protein